MFIVLSIEKKVVFWQTVVMFTQRKSCYCAFCKVERKVYARKHLRLIDVLGLVLLGVTFTYVVFQSLDPRGLFIVAMFLIVGEVFTQGKRRASMICLNCGFDPVLYLRSPEQAGLKIKAFLDKRAESPEYLLKPPVVLPVKKATGQNLSLKI